MLLKNIRPVEKLTLCFYKIYEITILTTSPYRENTPKTQSNITDINLQTFFFDK